MSKLVPGMHYSSTATLEHPQPLHRGTDRHADRQTAFAHMGGPIPAPEALQSLLCVGHCASGRGQQGVVMGVPTTGTSVQ